MSQLDDRQSIRDLDGVRVAVEGPIPAGMSADAIKARIETRLRRAGITVLGMGEFPTGDPHLRLTFALPADRGDLAATFVQLDFAQIVFLRRNPQVTFNRAQTWKATSGVILTAPAAIPDDVNADIDTQIDQFIAAYRAANA